MIDHNLNGQFFQQGPALGNQYIDNKVLAAFLAWKLPVDIHEQIEPGLDNPGDRVSRDIILLANEAEANPPELIHFDPWSRGIDQIKVSHAWHMLHDIAASESVVATAYERKQGEFSRLHQFVRLYLFHPSFAMVSCPLAMTDGAARMLALWLAKIYICSLLIEHASRSRQQSGRQSSERLCQAVSYWCNKLQCFRSFDRT